MLETNQKFISYPSRWLMLSLFCALNFCNAMLWVTFAPISDSSVDYFNGNSTSSSSSVGNITAINMLAVIFQILYGPGTVLGTILMKKNGLRYTLLCGGLFMYK
jgi:FLVCR family MFS transporter 7